MGPSTLRRGLLTLTLALCLTSISAQSRQAVIRIAPFSFSGISQSEAAMMERLVSSYVAELRRYRLIDSEGQDLALSETEAALSVGATVRSELPLSADFVLSGSLGRIGDLYALTLDMVKVSTGERLSVSDTAASMSDIVLRARGLTRSLFGEAVDAEAPIAKPERDSEAATEGGGERPSERQAAPMVQAPTLAELSGTWRGDKGLETVRVFANGSALAVLSGGGTLKLRISIAGATVVIDQDQPNAPAMYRSSSWGYDEAKRIAELARPMRWIMNLSADYAALIGTKETSAVSGSGGSLVVDNDYVREASWTRIAR